MFNQLSPANFGSGQGVALSPMGSGSYLHPSSLARVLAPWSQQGGAPQSIPVGSLEALRATWRAPHNSYNTGKTVNQSFHALQKWPCLGLHQRLILKNYSLHVEWLGDKKAATTTSL